MTALLVLLPVVVAGERVRRGSGRRLLRWGISIVATLCGVRFDVQGRSALDLPRSVVVANHSSPMDIPALLWADPDVRFMAAADLFRIPVLAAAMRAVGTVPIDRRNHDRAHDQLDEMVDERLRGAGGDVVVFAEGGIAPAGQRLPFKSGAFSLAIRTTSPLVPVAIHGSDRVLPPRGRLVVRSGVVTVEFLDAIDTSGLTTDDRRVLRDHVHDLVCDALGGVGVEPTARTPSS
ncbi:MAG TPA: lysophospholipid acyltransferase family protein [Acidimicrobiales bacterium]